MTVRVRLGATATVEVADVPDGSLWLPLDDLLGALDWHVTPLGDQRIGLCPDEQRCVPVPPEAVSNPPGQAPRIDLGALADPLGVSVVRHGRFAAVVPHTAASRTPAAASGRGIVLPEVTTGEPVPLAEAGRRRCVFAWASW